MSEPEDPPAPQAGGFTTRRQHPRFHMNLEVHYRAEGEQYVNFSENVSLGGVFIHARKPLPPGTLVTLTFNLPGSDQVVQVDGEVIWALCNEPQDTLDGRSGMGIQFMNLHTTAEKTLGTLLKGIPVGKR